MLLSAPSPVSSRQGRHPSEGFPGQSPLIWMKFCKRCADPIYFNGNCAGKLSSALYASIITIFLPFLPREMWVKELGMAVELFRIWNESEVLCRKPSRDEVAGTEGLRNRSFVALQTICILDAALYLTSAYFVKISSGLTLESFPNKDTKKWGGGLEASESKPGVNRLMSDITYIFTPYRYCWTPAPISTSWCGQWSAMMGVAVQHDLGDHSLVLSQLGI